MLGDVGLLDFHMLEDCADGQLTFAQHFDDVDSSRMREDLKRVCFKSSQLTELTGLDKRLSIHGIRIFESSKFATQKSFWSIGVLEYWSAGVLEWWSVGVVEC